jgi:hypothetical protein
MSARNHGREKFKFEKASPRIEVAAGEKARE